MTCTEIGLTPRHYHVFCVTLNEQRLCGVIAHRADAFQKRLKPATFCYISATFPATYQLHVDFKTAGPASFRHQGIRLAHIRSRDHARAPTASCQINPGRTWPGCGPSSLCQPFLPD